MNFEIQVKTSVSDAEVRQFLVDLGRHYIVDSMTSVIQAVSDNSDGLRQVLQTVLSSVGGVASPPSGPAGFGGFVPPPPNGHPQPPVAATSPVATAQEWGPVAGSPAVAQQPSDQD